MKSETPRHWLQWSLIVAMGAAVGVLLWWTQHWQESLSLEKGKMKTGYGGTDWVQWEDTPAGVTARRVHPLVSSHELLTGRYVQPGDVLLRIDYLPVHKAEVVDRLTMRRAPGAVFIFTVKRGDNETPLNLLITNAPLPHLTGFETPALWSLFPWLAAIGAFLSLLSLLILFPVIRPELRENGPALGVLTGGLVLFSLLLLRHLTLLLSTDFSFTAFEPLSLWLAMALMGGVAVFYFHTRLTGIARLFTLLSLAMTVWQLVQGWQWIYSDDFARYAMLWLQGFLFWVSVLTLGGMLLSLNATLTSLSRADAVFHALALLLSGWLCLRTVPLGAPMLSEGTAFAALAALLIPVLNTAASRLKFGRVSLVLSRSLQFALFALFTLVLWFIIHQTFNTLEFNFRYQPFLEVASLIVLILVFRAVYAAYEPRLRRYFVFALDRRREQFQQFISRIPQYSSSRQLCEDTVNETSLYFGKAKVYLWLSEEARIFGDPPFGTEHLQEIYAALPPGGEPWSLNPQLPSAEGVPAGLSDQLQSWGLELALPVRMKENVQGLLLLGRKGRGVYNLDDLEQLSRLVQQVRLTLGVLQLLEQERVLMEKNYQANLTALRSQINPHFLFNTLNTISSLIHEAPDEAEKATEKLAFIFRYTLKNSENIFVTIGNELSLVRTYLEIEHLRFGARLEVQWNVDPALESLEIPAFVIQTVIENSIKHGIGRTIGKGVVQIGVQKAADLAEITIVDNGPGIDLTKVTSSTGLNNILSRLEKVYLRKNLLIFENTGKGTRVTIRIPLKPAANA